MRRTSHGFTLIELLVVVAILVALAGLILPKLDGVVLKSNRGIGANTISGVDRYVQTYRVLHNAYPDYYDSLLGVGATGLATCLNDELTGVGGIHTKLRFASGLTTGGDSNLASLARVGITHVCDWNGETDSPSGEFKTVRDLASGTRAYATLNVTTLPSAIAGRVELDPVESPTNDGDAGDIYKFIYPQGTDPARLQRDDAVLLVVGFGRNNTAIGDVVNNAPLYPNSDPRTKYCHYLLVFEVKGDHDRAIFKCALGSDGDLMQGEIDEYFSQGNGND